MSAFQKSRIEALKRLDPVAGGLLCRLLPRPVDYGSNSEINRILIIRPGGIGDAVLLVPTILAIKRQFPQSNITVLAEKRNAEVFSLTPSIDRLLHYDVLTEFWATFRCKPDLVIDTEQWHKLSAIVSRLTGATILIGYATNKRAKLFHHAIPYSQSDYEAESFSHLLAPLGINAAISISTPFLSVPVPAYARATRLLAPLAGRPLIVLFPGASIPERRWGAKQFHQVAVRLVKQGYGIVIVGSKDDHAAGDTIVHPNVGLNLAGQTSLTETAAILQCSQLLISGDSGILHLAVGLGLATVSLFGPGIAKKWAPQGPKHIVINHHLPCSPCTKFGFTQRCQHNAECITKISHDEVFQAATAILKLASMSG